MAEAHGQIHAQRWTIAVRRLRQFVGTNDPPACEIRPLRHAPAVRGPHGKGRRGQIHGIRAQDLLCPTPASRWLVQQAASCLIGP